MTTIPGTGQTVQGNSDSGNLQKYDADAAPRIVCLLYGGPERKIQDRMNRIWRFEDHPYCGPSVVDRHGDPLTVQPPENSPFWEAVNLWYAQGKRVRPPIGKDVFCIWDKPTMRKMRHLGGRHYELVPDDETHNAKVSRGAEAPEESAAGSTSARPLGSASDD